MTHLTLNVCMLNTASLKSRLMERTGFQSSILYLNSKILLTKGHCWQYKIKELLKKKNPLRPLVKDKPTGTLDLTYHITAIHQI